MVIGITGRFFYVFITLCIGLQFSYQTIAQTSDQYTVYTQRQGLASGTITQIEKDSTGFIWLLSEMGLTRFDGYHFKTFKHDPDDSTSISYPGVLEMKVHKNGKILFRTGKGISSYNASNGSFRNLMRVARYDDIREFFCNDWGFWITTYNELVHINAGNEAVTSYPFSKNIEPVSAGNKIDPVRSFWFNKKDSIISFNTVTKKLLYTPVQYLGARDEKRMAVYANFYRAPSGNFYFARNDGIFKFDMQQQLFEQTMKIKLPKDVVEQPTSNPRYGPYYISKQFYNTFSVINIETGKEKQVTLKSKRANTGAKIQIAMNQVYRAADGSFWIATASDGVFHYSPDLVLLEQLLHDENAAISLPGNKIAKMLIDGQILWMSLPGIGLVKYERYLPAFKSYQPPKGENTSRRFENYRNVRAICETSDNKVLIGTFDQIYAFDKVTQEVKPFLPSDDPKRSLQQIGASAIIVDANGNTWISDWYNKGIFIINKNSNRLINISLEEIPGIDNSRTIRCMFLDSHGYVWIGTNENFIYRINSRKIDFANTANNRLETIKGSISKTDTLIFNSTFAFAENKKNEILLGTLNGLYKYSYTSGSFKRYTHQLGNASSLSDNEIRSFCIDNTGVTWIGTNSGGLNRFDEETETFTSFTTKNGLPDNSVYSIQKDEKGNLWLGTNNGICRFTIANKTCTNFSLKDGIQNAEFNTNASARLRSGELVFGGVNGFNIIDPDNLNTFSDENEIVITQFKVGDKEMPVKENYMLNHDENNFSFEFALLNFFRNDENNYAYKLEGLDKDWTYSNERRFTNYANLAPGNYTFRVKAANHFGDWSNEKSVVIMIGKPWYATWAFQIIAAILLFTIIFALFRYRLNNKMKMQEIRNRIASDLHDEIGSTLSSISLYSEVAHKIVKQKAPEANSMMTHISESTSNMMEALSDIVWTINTRNDTFKSVINRMRAFAVDMLEAKGSNLQFEAGEEVQSLQLDMEQRKNFYLIFKEAINNVAKYAEAKNVTVHLSSKNKTIWMKIADDGKGFDPDNETQGNGLINMRKRAMELKGELMVHAEPQKGTIVELRFGF